MYLEDGTGSENSKLIYLEDRKAVRTTS